MSEFFVDTSALAKIYLNEVGSTWVRRWAKRGSGNVIIISHLTSIEFLAALSRRQKEGNINIANFTILSGAFLTDKDEFYLTLDIDDPVIIRARSLVTRYPLRTLDAIQLASALEAINLLGARPTFISADTRLLTAASAEGLPIDDPNTHP